MSNKHSTDTMQGVYEAMNAVQSKSTQDFLAVP